MVKSVGFIGLGKLGLPCAAAMSVEAGVRVVGFDVDPNVKKYVRDSVVPYMEAQCNEYLSRADIAVVDSVSEVVEQTDLIFVAVQTPHDPQFEGISPVPDELSDFDYSFLDQAIRSICESLASMSNKSLTVVVISTVLPGTMRRVVLPHLESLQNRVTFCYNPFFIAMGQTIQDFLHPEFVLIGVDDPRDARGLADLYGRIHSAPNRVMRIESAELTKVAYNTFIGFKIVFANTLREIVEARGGDVDEVTSALSSATDRLISGRYLSAGMGDGGGCHPRDQIAMSWLAESADLSTDVFGFLARARDAQSLRQASALRLLSEERRLPLVILGTAYKANINLTVGSPSLLLIAQLGGLGCSVEVLDPLVFPGQEVSRVPAIFFVATPHDVFRDWQFPPGSVVIDPWGDVVGQDPLVEVLRPGRQ